MKKYNRIIIHRGRLNCSGNNLAFKKKRQLAEFENLSSFTSSFASKLKPYFDEIVYLVSVNSSKDCQEIASYDNGMKYGVVTFGDLKNKYMYDCDVFFQNGDSNIKPPTDPISVYYSSVSIPKPQRHANKWNAILVTPMKNGNKDKISQKIKGNIYCWIKGLSEDFWIPVDNSEKIYDYIVVGRRRKRLKVLKQLLQGDKDIKVAVVGFPKNIIKSKQITYFPHIPHAEIKGIYNQSKMAIISSMPKTIDEGFPMLTQLEYSAMGLYYVYDGGIPSDGFYVNDKTGIKYHDDFVMPENHIELGELARKYALDNFSSAKSAECLIKIINKLGEK